jgi:hypothetical protein
MNEEESVEQLLDNWVQHQQEMLVTQPVNINIGTDEPAIFKIRLDDGWYTTTNVQPLGEANIQEYPF